MFNKNNKNGVLESHTKIFQDFIFSLIRNTHRYFVEEDNLIQRERDMNAFFRVPYNRACEEFVKHYFVFRTNEELYSHFLKYFIWNLYRSEEGLQEMLHHYRALHLISGLSHIMDKTERSGRKLVSVDSRTSHRVRYNPQ